jgi:hypothetical protein
VPLDHVALTVADRERFRAAGIEEIEFDASGPKRVQVEDPDGYRVELYAY